MDESKFLKLSKTPKFPLVLFVSGRKSSKFEIKTIHDVSSCKYYCAFPPYNGLGHPVPSEETPLMKIRLYIF